MSAEDLTAISVFILADIRLFRDGLAEILARRDGFAVIGAASHYEDAVPMLRSLRPQIVLVDVVQPEALEAVRAIVRAVPEAKVIALAVRELEPEVLRLAEAGIAGYVARDAGLGHLIACIESVARGEALCAPRITAALLRRIAALAADRPAGTQRSELTAREVEVVALIRDGLSNKEIARALSIELSTVKNHVHNILEKLGARRRAEAAARVVPLLGSVDRSASI